MTSTSQIPILQHATHFFVFFLRSTKTQSYRIQAPLPRIWDPASRMLDPASRILGLLEDPCLSQYVELGGLQKTETIVAARQI